MIPRRRKAPKMAVTERGPIRCSQHLQHVRGYECSAAGHGNCFGKVEAHHIREGGSGGMGMKPNDSEVVPLCSTHHQEGHTISWKTFEAKYGLSLETIAAKLWQISPHRRRACDGN